MRIQIHPIAGLPGQADDTASVLGDTLTHNGTEFDLSAVPDEGQATPSGNHPFVGTITRDGGVLTFGLRMAYSRSTGVSDQPRDPSYWAVDISEGVLPDLVVRRAGA